VRLVLLHSVEGMEISRVPGAKGREEIHSSTAIYRNLKIAVLSKRANNQLRAQCTSAWRVSMVNARDCRVNDEVGGDGWFLVTDMKTADVMFEAVGEHWSRWFTDMGNHNWSLLF
jgi:hypothetical protein